MRRLAGAAPLVGQDHDAARRDGIDLGIEPGALPLAPLLRHGLTLDAAGLAALCKRYSYRIEWPFKS
jgi:hypothetical protein